MRTRRPEPCVGFGIERTHSDVLVRRDVGYLCASFSLPRPLCSRLRPDVRDRQTSDVHRRLILFLAGCHEK